MVRLLRVRGWGLRGNQLLATVIIGTSILLAVLSSYKKKLVYRKMYGRPKHPLTTVWGENLDVSNVLSEYPRPNLVRKNWKNLNGLWEYALVESMETDFTSDGKILVPFCLESYLSMVYKDMDSTKYLAYRRSMRIPSDWRSQRINLNFEAVDYQTTVYVNKQLVGTHKGGYDAFSFDITDFLDLKKDDQSLVVFVEDPTEKEPIPLGKQWSGGDRENRFIFYEATSGIWQTVWLEPVPSLSISNIKIDPDIDTGLVSLAIETEGATNNLESVTVSATVKFGPTTVKTIDDHPLTNEIVISLGNTSKLHLWSPETPNLYSLTIQLKNGDNSLPDIVESYFGMRKIETRKVDGSMRVFLNNKYLRFQLGPLDQGYWPDGLLTAPSEQALLWDVQKTKELGFNMIRKHIKIESRRWYYLTDKLGLLVWQDFPAISDIHDMENLPAAQQNFKSEYRRWMKQLHNHPSIILWVVFNEAWGQHNTVKATLDVMSLDPSRLVTCASGWYDHPAGHVVDKHPYPGPTNKYTVASKQDKNRIFVVGEMWGMSLIVWGHTWFGDEAAKADPRGGVQTTPEFLKLYKKLTDQLDLLIDREDIPYTAACMTQLTDVEGEFNGFYTYDRKMEKAPTSHLAIINKKLLQN